MRIPPNNPGDDDFPEPMDKQSWQRWSTCCKEEANEDYVEGEWGEDVQNFRWICTKCKKPCRIYKPERSVEHDMRRISRGEKKMYFRHPYYDRIEEYMMVTEVWECMRCKAQSEYPKTFSYCTTEVFDPITKSYQLQIPCATPSQKY